MLKFRYFKLFVFCVILFLLSCKNPNELDVPKASYCITNSYLWDTPRELTSDSFQAIAVYDHYVIRTWKRGSIAIYDLKKNCELLFSLVLPLGEDILPAFHAANVCFGTEFYSNDSDFPALYVSETTGMKRCFVFDLKLDGTCTLIQVLQYVGRFGVGEDYHDFMVDRGNEYVYIEGYNNYGAKDNYLIIKKMPLINLECSDYSYSDSEVKGNYQNKRTKVLQGSFIHENVLFYGDQRNVVNAYDLTTGQVIYEIDFSSLTGELEGIAYYQGEILVDVGEALVSCVVQLL